MACRLFLALTVLQVMLERDGGGYVLANEMIANQFLSWDLGHQNSHSIELLVVALGTCFVITCLLVNFIGGIVKDKASFLKLELSQILYACGVVSGMSAK